MTEYGAFLLAMVLLLPFSTCNAVHVRTESDLREALSSRARIVLVSSITMNTELPIVTKSTTIVGHRRGCGSKLCYIDAQHKSRHLSVAAGARLSLFNLELRNGNSTHDGGAVLVSNAGSVLARNITFIDNHVGAFCVGGAVAVTNGSSAVILNSFFMNNGAGFGGAIGISGESSLDVRKCLFINNMAVIGGGGLQFLSNSTGILVNNTYHGNAAPIGGAANAHGSWVNVCGAAVNSNTATLRGADMLSEGNSSVRVCKASVGMVSGGAIADCRPCSALGPPPGVKGDPHIRGPHGEAFDFDGLPDTTYCLITDHALQLNMQTMAGLKPASTYIKELGFLYRNETLIFSATPSLPDHYQGTLFVNSNEMPAESNTWELSHNLSITRTRDEVVLEVAQLLWMSFRVIKIPSKTYLNLNVALLKASSQVHGIFGQLYRNDPSGSRSMSFKGHGKFKQLQNAEDYQTSGILQTDCKYRVFRGT